MDFLVIALMGVGLVACMPTPQFPVYGVYLAQPHMEYNHPYPYLQRPAVFAPQPPLRRTAAAPAASPVAPLVHNSITYRVDPDADPDDALEVAQFHSQDAAGRVVFGFNTPSQSRMEARSLDGSVRGSYSYQDPTGKTVKMHYWDDGTGFHTIGNNLPATFYSSPGYTPEVQEARERHFQLYREALATALGAGPGEEEELQPNSSVVSVASAAPDGPADQTADDTKSAESDYDSDSDAVAIENADFYARQGTYRMSDPEAGRRQVAQARDQVSDLTLDRESQLAIARTGADGYQYLVPVAVPAKELSESEHATLYGAIPVAAVHDSQVSPLQNDSIDNHQVKPVLVRTGLAKTS